MIAPALVLEPGDRVLVVIDQHDLDQPSALGLKYGLEARFPGVEFTVLAAQQLAVLEPVPGAEAFTCPSCRARSYNPNDLREGYCGRCHDFTATPAAASAAREGRST